MRSIRPLAAGTFGPGFHWSASVALLLFAFVCGWIVRDAARTGSITVGKGWFRHIATKNDEPFQFWFAFLAHCVGVVLGLVGSVAVQFL